VRLGQQLTPVALEAAIANSLGETGDSALNFKKFKSRTQDSTRAAMQFAHTLRRRTVTMTMGRSASQLEAARQQR